MTIYDVIKNINGITHSILPCNQAVDPWLVRIRSCWSWRRRLQWSDPSLPSCVSSGPRRWHSGRSGDQLFWQHKATCKKWAICTYLSILWVPLNGITLGQIITDPINQMIAISEWASTYVRYHSRVIWEL